MMTRGEIARRAGVGGETVRFYERQGLLDEPRRTRSGYRQYDAAALRRLKFIRRAKELGFSLREIRDLLTLRLDDNADCTDVQQRAEQRLAEVRARIRDLRRMEARLKELTAACGANRKKMECPLLDALEEAGE
ncbi:MAG: MerR family DNA-binding protein [Gemmatimonadota bacterium]